MAPAAVLPASRRYRLKLKNKGRREWEKETEGEKEGWDTEKGANGYSLVRPSMATKDKPTVSAHVPLAEWMT